MKRKLLLSFAMLLGSLASFAQTAVDVDKTALVKTDVASWGGGDTYNHEVTTADGRTVKMVEHYYSQLSQNEDKPLKQIVTGLDDGEYTVSLYAKTNCANWDFQDAFPVDFVDGSTEYAKVYGISGENQSSAPIEADAARSYNLPLKSYDFNITVTGGTLEIGMELIDKTKTNWHTIQIKSLVWHTTTDVLLASEVAALDAKIAEAEAVENPTESLVAAIAAAKAAKENATTAEELQAAIAALAKAIAIDANTKLVASATPLAPVAAFLQNGTFDTNKVTAPWKTTTGAQNQTTANNQAGAFTGNFFENWNPNPFTGKIYQTMENVPNGTYKLQIAAFVETFANPNDCQYVYANADKTYLTAGAPTAYEVYTVVTDNKIEVGFEQTTAVTRWCGIDNVKLYYCGEGDVKDAAMNAGPILALINAYNEALVKVNTLDAAGKAKFNELTVDIKAAVDNGTIISAEESDQMIATLKDAVLKAVAAQTTPGSDMTLLIVNAAVANAEGWTNAGINQNEQYNGAPDSKYLDYNNWGQDAYAEKDMFQLVALPAGVYQLKAATRASATDSEGSCIYATVGSEKVTADVNHNGNADGELGRGWSWTTIDNIVVEEPSDVQIGFIARARMYGWAGADDFHLTYVSRHADLTLDLESGADIAAALEGKNFNNLTINLAENGTYTMNSAVEVPAELVVNGNGATVTLGETAQFIIQSGLVLDNLKIDAAAMTAQAIIQLSENPNETAKAENTIGYKRSGAYFIELPVQILNSEIKNLKKSIIYNGTLGWGLNQLTLKNNNIQMDNATETYIKMDGGSSNNTTIIKMNIEENTIWNVAEKSEGYFLRYCNQSNGQATKWTDEGKSVHTFIHNTFYRSTTNKNFANNIQNSAINTVVLKNNIFFDCNNLNKYIQGQTTKDIADNVFAYDKVAPIASDIAFGVEANPEFVDAANGNFTIGAGTKAAEIKAGASRWLVEYDPTTAIENAIVETVANGVIYNLAGQKVDASYKGIVIKNGKKALVK